MSARPWMPLYVGDYLADTTHLNAAQHGAYLLLILHYWRKGGLPDDDVQLAQIAAMSPAEWRKHRPVIRSFFDGGWKHGRIEHELAVSADKYERRAAAGRKGGKATRKSSNASAMLNQSQPQPQLLRSSLSQREGVSKGIGRALDQREPTWPALAVVNGEDGR